VIKQERQGCDALRKVGSGGGRRARGTRGRGERKASELENGMASKSE
jgi:hypothetical protein